MRTISLAPGPGRLGKSAQDGGPRALRSALSVAVDGVYREPVLAWNSLRTGPGKSFCRGREFICPVRDLMPRNLTRPGHPSVARLSIAHSARGIGRGPAPGNRPPGQRICLRPGFDPGQRLDHRVLRRLAVVVGLQADPPLRHTNFLGQTVLGDTHRLQELLELYLARRWLGSLAHYFAPSVIVENFNTFRPGIRPAGVLANGRQGRHPVTRQHLVHRGGDRE